MAEKLNLVSIGCPELSDVFSKIGYHVLALNYEESLSNSAKLGTPRAFVIKSSKTSSTLSLEKIKQLRKLWPIVDILIWAPSYEASDVLAAMKAGAKDIILNASPVEVTNAVDRVVHTQQILPRVGDKNKKRRAFRFEGMVSRDPSMWDIFDNIAQMAPTDASTLVLGKTGTGKELVARSIHKLSNRKGRFVAVNCAAIPENLVDSELFGHVKGAFTGASSEKRGLFRYADGGSIFLDEIGDMPLSTQYHLLRVLQENTVRPVGGHEEIPINVRIIAATSSPLEELVEKGDFREDLLYRLDVMRVVLPPLRDRGDDILFLFSHFTQKFSKQYKLTFPKMSDAFLDEVVKYPWPGNVRQLANIAERLILSQPGERLLVNHLRKALRPFQSEPKPTADISTEYSDLSTVTYDYKKPMVDAIKPHVLMLEKSYLLPLLKKNEGRIGLTAEQAGVSRRTVLRKLTEWGVDKAEFKNKKNESIGS